MTKFKSERGIVLTGRLLHEYRMIGMTGISKEYGRLTLPDAREIYASIYIFNAHLLMRLYVFAMLATSPTTI